MIKKTFIFLTAIIGLTLILSQLIKANISQSRPHTIIYATTIILDAGHGGKDGGASTATGIHERDIVLNITKIIEEQLRIQGFNVIMTRSGDADLASPNNTRNRKKEDLTRRVEIFNTTSDAIAISIHANAINNARWSGAQTFFDPKRRENKELATQIMTSLQNNLHNLTREARPISNIYILRNSTIPTALVEVGFLSNQAEAQLLTCPDYQQLIAYAIFEGILSYLEFSGMRVPLNPSEIEFETK